MVFGRAIGLFFLLLLCAVRLAVAEAPQINGVRSGALDDASRLVIETSQHLPVSLFLLAEPYRLVVDLPASRWRVGTKPVAGELSAPLFKGYRFGAPQSEISRLVIDLDTAAVPEQIFWLPPQDGRHRLVIDLVTRGETAFRIAAQGLLKNQNQNQGFFTIPEPITRQAGATPLPRARPIPPTASRAKFVHGVPPPPPRPLAANRASGRVPPRWVVFVDPGHGGKDPGAISVNGHHEKDITLKAAHELAKQLEATGRIKVVLSRRGDKYLRLRERIALARMNRADVFISLHADAAPSSKARGVSVFTLSDQASDKEAELLARRENKVDLIDGADLGSVDPEITPVLLGIFQRETKNQSSMLAGRMLMAFDDLPTLKRGHRFAGFAVLKSPDIPSVLVEMGFLTNKQDERYLLDATYRRQIMQRVTRAVVAFLEASRPPLPNVLAKN